MISNWKRNEFWILIGDEVVLKHCRSLGVLGGISILRANQIEYDDKKY
jgi:hypothetical protein